MGSISSSSAQVGRSIRKFRIYSNNPGSYGFDGTFTGNDFADFLLGTSKIMANWRSNHGLWNNVSWLPTFRITGAQLAA